MSILNELKEEEVGEEDSIAFKELFVAKVFDKRLQVRHGCFSQLGLIAIRIESFTDNAGDELINDDVL